MQHLHVSLRRVFGLRQHVVMGKRNVAGGGVRPTTVVQLPDNCRTPWIATGAHGLSLSGRARAPVPVTQQLMWRGTAACTVGVPPSRRGPPSLRC